MGNVDVNDIKTMEEAIAAIGYVQRKFENEWELVEEYMKRNDTLLGANVSLRKNLVKTRKSRKFWIGTSIIFIGTSAYLLLTSKKEYDRGWNKGYREGVDDEKEFSDDIFVSDTGTED